MADTYTCYPHGEFGTKATKELIETEETAVRDVLVDWVDDTLLVREN